MRAFLLKTFAVCVLLVSAVPMAAADLLFVFRGDTAEAAVYDADSLSLLASPAVGFGADQVFGLPSSEANDRFAKFFVVGRDAVIVLDAEFQVRRSLSLGEASPAGRRTAVLAAGGSRLLVAAGAHLAVIDTAQESVVYSAELPFAVQALAALPRTGEVSVLAQGSPVVRLLNLETYEIEEAASLMPEAAQDVVASPSGAWVYAVAGRALHDLRAASVIPVPAGWDGSSASASQGGPGSALSGEVRRSIALADSGRYAVVSSGRVYTGWLSGSSDAAEVTVDRNGGTGTLEATGIALSSNGRHLIVADGLRRLSRIDLDQPDEMQSAALSFEPSVIALVSPTAGQAAGMLEQVSPPRQTIAGGKNFTLEVRAVNASGSTESNITVFASSFNPAMPAVECFSDVTGTDGVGALFCTTAEVTAPRLVRVTVSDTAGRSAPSFEVALVPPTEADGLSKVSGDFEAVPEEAEFDLVVAASQDRVPQEGLGLVITPVPGRPIVICPPQVFTDENGEATITCTSGVVGDPDEGPLSPVDVMITVTDGSRSVVFTVTIDPDLTISEGLAIVSGDAQRTSNGVEVPFPLVVRSVIDGVPQPGESLAISVSNMRALTCPAQVFTDDDGFAFIRCRGGVVFGEETHFVTIGGPRGSQVQFSVIVRATPQGLANEIEILTAEPIEATVGEVRPNAVRVIATTGGGQRVAGRTVYFTSEDGVTFDPPSVVTDGFGEATTTVTFGCSDRNRGSIEVGFSEDEVEESIDFDLTPGPFARIDKLQGDNQTGVPGQTLSQAALLVQVGDMCGNPLTEQKVDWRVHPEPRATFRNLVDITNQSGRSSVLVQLGSYGGPFTVTAQAGEVVATFNLSVAMEPSQLQKLSGDGQTAAAGNIVAQPLVVELEGTNGFGVSGVDVTFSVTQGSATLTRPESQTDGLGLAYTAVQMGDGGPVTVTATAIGQSVSFTLGSGSGGGPNAPLAGFVNGASFEAGWVPGSLGTIFGTGITGVNGVVSGAVPFATNLQGVTVTVNGISAPIIALINVNGQEQINLQVPFGIQPGTATVVINNNGSSVTVNDVPILGAQPGIFEFALDGMLYAAALHADFTVVTPDNPARPGEVILLFVTGLGSTNPEVGTNEAGPSSPLAQTVLDPAVNLGGAEMEDFGGYYAPTLATAYQINFRVAENATSGNLEIYVVINGVSSQVSKLPVQSP